MLIFVFLRAPQATIHHWEILAAACVTFGAVLSLIPFYLDYRAMGKAIEVNALGAVAEKIQNLDTLSAQISAVTNRWEIIDGVDTGPIIEQRKFDRVEGENFESFRERGMALEYEVYTSFLKRLTSGAATRVEITSRIADRHLEKWAKRVTICACRWKRSMKLKSIK